jgi:hypothetical protein
MQAGERHCVPPVNLDPIARFARDQVRRDHHAFMAAALEVPVDPIAARAGLIDEPQCPAAPANARQQLVQRRWLVRDLSYEPDLAIPTSLRNTDGDRRLVHV